MTKRNLVVYSSTVSLDIAKAQLQEVQNEFDISVDSKVSTLMNQPVLSHFAIVDIQSLTQDELTRVLDHITSSTILIYHDAHCVTPFLQDLLARPNTCLQWKQQHSILITELRRQYREENLKATSDSGNQILSGFGDCFIQVNEHGHVKDVVQSTKLLVNELGESLVGKPWYHLVSVNTTLSSNHVLQFISSALRTRAMTRIPPFALNTSDGACYLVDGIVTSTVLQDGSHGATLALRELSRLDSVLNQRQLGLSADSSLKAIMVLSPDNLVDINNRYGRSDGDQLLQTMSKVIQEIIPITELANHYGGSTFIVLFKSSSEEQIIKIAKRLFKALKEIKLDNIDMQLSFSLGLALNESLSPCSLFDLFQQACHAMVVAQRLGGDQLRTIRTEHAMQQVGDLDKLSGNLTLNATHDYLSLLMTYSILSDDLNQLEGRAFINALLKQLVSGLGLTSATHADVSRGRVINAATARAGQEEVEENFSLQLTASQNALISGAIIKGSNPSRVLTSMTKAEEHEILLPIIQGQNVIGLLLLKLSHQYAVKTKNHLLLENIADYVRVKLQHDSKALPLHSKTKSAGKLDDLLFKSPQMQSLVSMLKTVAPTEATVLVTGESGTGKELIAQSLHRLSKRSEQPFVVFDCGAIVENLIESELFGHTKGAFTGATHNKQGAIAKAEGGTLFLDEVGELPIDTQAKLLRFVQERQYSMVGKREPQKADVRIVAATNVDLEKRMQSGLFREDLYYRLNVINLKSYPLRHRRQDITPIAEFYLRKFSQQYEKSIVGFRQSAIQAMHEYSWHGNVRELVNLVHRAVVICQDNQISEHDLGLYTTSEADDSMVSSSDNPNQSIQAFGTELGDKEAHPSADSRMVWFDYLQQYTQLNLPVNAFELIEAKILQSALASSNNVTLQAAGTLGIAESTFRRRWSSLKDVAVINEPSLTPVIQQVNALTNDYAKTVNRLTKIKQELVQASAKLDLSINQAAYLLGMSPPTYRKVLNSLS